MVENRQECFETWTIILLLTFVMAVMGFVIFRVCDPDQVPKLVKVSYICLCIAGVLYIVKFFVNPARLQIILSALIMLTLVVMVLMDISFIL